MRLRATSDYPEGLTIFGRTEAGTVWVGEDRDIGHMTIAEATDRLDLESTATKGCLLGLAREAWEDPTVAIIFHDAHDAPGWVPWGNEATECGVFGRLPTEHEALIATLAAAADLQGCAS
jgi:hypothetical protein